MPRLFHEILNQGEKISPLATALQHKDKALTYQQLKQQVEAAALALVATGLRPGERVAIYLPKQFEAVIAFFAVSMAGGVFVPVNPLLKAPQVKHILKDCEVSLLITSLSRWKQVNESLSALSSLRKTLLTDCTQEQTPQTCSCWATLTKGGQQLPLPNRISQDIAAILYTSGSTGKPKGVVLSHNNLCSGAKSVAEYLEQSSSDRLLAVLPFSFDYGLSQLTTAFLSGASVVLMEYLFPRDVIKAVAHYQITGLAAVPPLWIQLSELDWPLAAKKSLRYWTNSGGVMPQACLQKLTEALPNSAPYLMYGLTEAFRSSYLPPSEIKTRPTSMGKAIPDAELLVLDNEGQECPPGEPGELVHRGPQVALGYWNAIEKTAERFRPLPKALAPGLTPEIAVWSGDTVTKDEDGFLYFVGRKDDMIKSSGYRISPAELEDTLYQLEFISEVAAIGVPHKSLGQAVVLVIKVKDPLNFDEKTILRHCQKQLPNFMQPKAVKLLDNLPLNANGKIDRSKLVANFSSLFN